MTFLSASRDSRERNDKREPRKAVATHNRKLIEDHKCGSFTCNKKHVFLLQTFVLLLRLVFFSKTFAHSSRRSFRERKLDRILLKGCQELSAD